MQDVERDPVVAEMMRLLSGAPHGTYTALARAAGLKAPESVRQWALGENRPPKKRWPAIERYFELDDGHIARIANETPPIVVEVSPLGDDELRREVRQLRADLQATDARLRAADDRVRNLERTFRKSIEPQVAALRAAVESLRAAKSVPP